MATNKNLPDLTSKNKIIVLVVLALIIVMGAVYYLSERPLLNSADLITIDGKPVENILLTNVLSDDSNRNGRAVRYDQDDKFFHEIVAELPALEEGKHYESWLFQTPNLYVSTGELKLLSEPIYTLSFVSDIDYDDYLKVVVTAQPDNNDKPNLFVLEGYFED